MAFPTVFDSLATNPGGTGSTLTVNLSTHAVDDILAIFLPKTGNAAWTVPAGWLSVDQRSVGTGSTGIVGTWFVRKVLSGDGLPLADPVCTLGATVTRTAACLTVRNGDLEGIFVTPNYGARGFATGTSNPVRPPTVINPAPEMLVIHGYGSRTATNAPDPSGYTQDEEVVISGTLVMNVSHKEVAAQNTTHNNQDASPTSGVRWVAGILCIPSSDYPYYRAGSQATTASGTSVTPTKPTGTSASDVNGNADVMIATVEGAGSTTLAAADSGLWAEVGGVWSGTTSGGGSSVKKFWCYATASPNMQFTRTGTGEISACVTTYYNCHQSDPIGVFDADARASSTTSTWDAITRGADKSAVQATCVADAVPTFNSPFAWIERMDGLGITCADQTYDAAGSSATNNFVLSAASPTLVGLLEILAPSVGGSATVIPGVASLTTAAFAPKVNLAVIPSTTSLTTASFASTLALNVIPSTAALTLSTFAVNLAVVPGTASLSTVTFAPELAETTTPSTASLTLSTFVANVNLAVIPSTTSLGLTAFAPVAAVSDHVAVIPSTASLVTSALAPTLALATIPDTPALTLSTFAPDAIAGDQLVVTPTTATLTTATFAPTVSVSDNVIVTPAAAALATSVFAPVLALDVVPSIGTIVLTGFAPSANVGNAISVTPDTASLASTGFAPSANLSDNISVTPSTATLSTTGFAPQLGESLVPSTASLVVTGFDPAVNVGNAVSVTPGTLSLSLSTFAPTITTTAHVTVTPATTALTVSQFVPVLAHGLTPATLSTSTTTFAPTVNTTQGVTVTPDTAVLTLNGINPIVNAGGNLTFEPGLASLNLTGHSPTLYVFTSTIASDRTYAITDNPRITIVEDTDRIFIA